MKKTPTHIVNIVKKKCCGCSSCVQVCPQQCINMKEDVEGFLYPSVDSSICVGCLKCEKTCPCLNQDDERFPIGSYASINQDSEIRKQSSSGGTFYKLAHKIIDEGGVVFGARFDDNLNVIHDLAVDTDGLRNFIGSKYVQSSISDCFKKCRELLQKGTNVLFAGTPCQIAGLRKFLQKDYANLITVDVICHGVPSPLVWRKYVKEVSQNKRITHMSFRDKRDGWYNYRVTFNSQNEDLYSCLFRDDPYMQLFLNDYTLRPSCYNCPAKSGRSGSDITLGDLWGVDVLSPSMYDGKGTGLVLVSTMKGKKNLLELNCLRIEEVDFLESMSRNKAWKDSYSSPSLRDVFFSQLKTSSIKSLYIKYIRPDLLLKNRLKDKIKKIIRNVFN